MIYIPCVILNFLFMIICYVFNPIVALFAGEDGNLPHCLRWFQTQDQSLDNDPEWVEKTWPLLAYKQSDSKVLHYIKRWAQRTRWMYRNTGYTFAYEVVGYKAVASKLTYKGDNPFDDFHHTSYMLIWEKDEPIWTRHWCLRANIAYLDNNQEYGYLRIFLGWKIGGMVENPNSPDTQCMLAMHINPFRNIGNFFKRIFKRGE